MLLSDMEAKRFLVEKIEREAARQGARLTEEDKRLLFYSVDDPESSRGISEHRLLSEDALFEERVSGLLMGAYQRDKHDPGQKQLYHDSLAKLKEGDHYILVMAAGLGGREHKKERSHFLLLVVAAILLLILLIIAGLSIER